MTRIGECESASFPRNHQDILREKKKFVDTVVVLEVLCVVVVEERVN